MRRKTILLLLVGVGVVCSADRLLADSDSVSVIDRLHFAINESEFTFAEGGPAFVTPATALAGLNPPTIRRAYLTRELERVEGLVTELNVRHAEDPDNKPVANRLAAMKGRAERLRSDLGLAIRAALPSPMPSVPKDAQVAMTGDDNHVFLRLRPGAAAASSVAYQNVDVGGVKGRVVTGTHAIEFQPTARLTGGLFGRSRFGEAWTEEEVDRAISAGWGVGAASSFEVNENVTLSAAVLYGRSWNEAAAAGSDATFGGDRLVADARADGRFWSGSWLWAPGIAAHYEQATRGSFVDSDGASAPDERHRRGQFGASAELSRSFVNFDGAEITTVHPFFRAGANLEFRPSDSGDDKSLSDFIGTSALVGGGLRVHFSEQASLMFSEEFKQDGEEGSFRFVAEIATPLGSNREQPLSTLNLSAETDHEGSVGASLQAVLRFR